MDINDLAKLIAKEEISQYDTRWFERVNCAYLCTLGNFSMATNRFEEKRIVFEFEVQGNSDVPGANPVGSDTKIVYDLKEWNLKKVKRHLKALLNCTTSDLQDDAGAKLIAEALEPMEEKDGKSVLSGMEVTLTVQMTNSQKRIAAGDGDYPVFTVTRGREAYDRWVHPAAGLSGQGLKSPVAVTDVKFDDGLPSVDDEADE